MTVLATIRQWLLMLWLLPGASLAGSSTALTTPHHQAIGEVTSLIEQHFYRQIDVPDNVTNSLEQVYHFLAQLDPYARIERTGTANRRSFNGLFGAKLLVSPINNHYLLLPVTGGQMAIDGFQTPIIIESIANKPISNQAQHQVLRQIHEQEVLNISFRTADTEDIVKATLQRGPSTQLEHVYKFDLSSIPAIQILELKFGETAFTVKRLLRDQLNNGECVAIDLRYNQGGDVSEIANLVEIFAQRPGEIAVLEYPRTGKRERIRVANHYGKCAPLVFVSTYTASAAEVLAAGLKNLAAATLIGERTFGKCASQRAYRISNGDKLKLTNAKFSEKYAGCNPRGMQPDIEASITFASKTELTLHAIEWSLGMEKQNTRDSID